jgi:hypothetical protein
MTPVYAFHLRCAHRAIPWEVSSKKYVALPRLLDVPLRDNSTATKLHRFGRELGECRTAFQFCWSNVFAL